MIPNETLIDGPYSEDLRHGQRFDDSPGLTLTEGLATAHRAIVGGRLPLALDGELSRRVLGAGGTLAAPNLAWDVAIGQSTTATHTVVANLFYRGVVFRRAPRIGDTLTAIEVEQAVTAAGGTLAHLRSRVHARRQDAQRPRCLTGASWPCLREA